MSKIQPLPIRVYFEDTDAGGVVYHARYLHFFERARTEYLRQLHFSQQSLIRDFDLAFVVKKMDIDFIFPARLDDALEVDTTISDIRGASLFFEQSLKKEGKALCKATVVIACVSLSQMKPTALPERLKHALLSPCEE